MLSWQACQHVFGGQLQRHCHANLCLGMEPCLTADAVGTAAAVCLRLWRQHAFDAQLHHHGQSCHQSGDNSLWGADAVHGAAFAFPKQRQQRVWKQHEVNAVVLEL